MGQNVLSVDLVVQHVEAISRFVLRLAIQLDLKFPVLPDSSSITAPSLLHKHNRSMGPFLHRNYPASSVVLPTPTPRLTVALSDDVGGRDPPPAPSLPHLPGSPSLHAVLTTPVDQIRCLLVCFSALPRSASSLSVLPSPLSRRVGVHIVTFEACSSFTRVTGRGRDSGRPLPPAQTRAGAASAHGSYLGCLASKRSPG